MAEKLLIDPNEEGCKGAGHLERLQGRVTAAPGAASLAARHLSQLWEKNKITSWGVSPVSRDAQNKNTSSVSRAVNIHKNNQWISKEQGLDWAPGPNHLLTSTVSAWFPVGYTARSTAHMHAPYTYDQWLKSPHMDPLHFLEISPSDSMVLWAVSGKAWFLSWLVGALLIFLTVSVSGPAEKSHVSPR